MTDKLVSFAAQLSQKEISDVIKGVLRAGVEDMGIEKEFNEQLSFIRDLIETKKREGHEQYVAFLLAMAYVSEEIKQ